MTKNYNPKKWSKVFSKYILGSYSGRTVHRIGIALLGIWITSSMINLILPIPDQIAPRNSSENIY